jgi:hypothetical protein
LGANRHCILPRWQPPSPSNYRPKRTIFPGRATACGALFSRAGDTGFVGGGNPHKIQLLAIYVLAVGSRTAAVVLHRSSLAIDAERPHRPAAAGH